MGGQLPRKGPWAVRGKGDRKANKPPAGRAQPKRTEEHADKAPEPRSRAAARGDAVLGILKNSFGGFLINVLEPGELRSGGVISCRINPKAISGPKCDSILHRINVGRKIETASNPFKSESAKVPPSCSSRNTTGKDAVVHKQGHGDQVTVLRESN